MKDNIVKLINTEYKTKKAFDLKVQQDVCWEFCRKIFRIFGINLPDHPHQGLIKVSENDISIPCVVLFRIGDLWHSGILWSDGLHFIHVVFESLNNNKKYMIRQDKITIWPWSNIIEGYYKYE